MKRLSILLPAILIVISSCSRGVPENFVLVKGGTFKNTRSNLYGKGAIIPDFLMDKYEVTQREWTEVMGSNPSQFKGDSLPVEMVSWYDCIEYCNARSLKEGLKPFYVIDTTSRDPNNKNETDSTNWTVTANAGANGYRLPTEAEWEYASGGGQLSRSFLYSGSDSVDDVAWYWRNSGDSVLTGFWFWPVIRQNHGRTRPVGLKKPNELGLYDMSGNVREWCWDWYEDAQITFGHVRTWRGGGWLGSEQCCASSFRGSFEANGKGPDQGLRVCRAR